MHALRFIKETVWGVIFCAGWVAAQDKAPAPNTAPLEEKPVRTNPHLALDPGTGRALYYNSLDKEKPALATISGSTSFERLINRGVEAVAADYMFITAETASKNGKEVDWRYMHLPDIGLMDEFWKPLVLTNRTRHWKPINKIRLFPGQIVGVECPVWRLSHGMEGYWEELGKRLMEHNRDFLLYTDYPDSQNGNLPSPLNNTYIRITPQRYMQFEKMAKDPAFAGGVIRDQLSTPFKGVKNTKPTLQVFNYRVLLDRDSGRFFTYGIFNADEPMNVDLSDFEVTDSIPSVGVRAMSRRMFEMREGPEEGADEGALLEVDDREKNGECIVYPYTLAKDEDELYALYLKFEAPWEREGRKKPGNMLTFYPGMAFGGECFIWDLKIWPLLGKRLAEQKQPYILYTFGSSRDHRLAFAPLDITKVPRDLAVLVDLDLYHRMEALRKAYLEPPDRGNDAFEGDDPAAE